MYNRVNAALEAVLFLRESVLDVDRAFRLMDFAARRASINLGAGGQTIRQTGQQEFIHPSVLFYLLLAGICALRSAECCTFFLFVAGQPGIYS